MAASTWTPPEPGTVPPPPRPAPHDIHTLSNIAQCRISHVHLEWTVDWEAKSISGSVKHDVVVLDDTDKLILDTSFLDIRSVAVDGKLTKDYELAKRHHSLGSALTIPIGSRHKDDKFSVLIEYSTTPECTALGWLSAEQTQGKKKPFLYSQCQAIHARSLVPIMDSPAHKITYTATVRSPIQVLMSALAEGSIRATEDSPGEPEAANEKGVYKFRQAVGIPCYLIAIVGGDLEFRSLAPRIGIYAEPPMADKAQWEFQEDANRFLQAAEQTISPYSWQRYDSVVLPPSFPYGGMENANLTTLTPALVCGDRSQTDVLLHELMHSWSGNLTSCASWTSFWLNEGINVWLERLLLQVVHGGENGGGAAYRGLGYIQGAKALKDALRQFEDNPRFQRLVPVFTDGEDPDDAFSSIPYEKGSNFVLHLERTVGSLDLFLPFIRSWFKTFYDTSVTTEEFKQHLFDFYAGSPEITQRLKDNVDWDAWLHGEGLELPVKLEYDDTLALQAFALAKKWQDVIATKADTKAFGSKDIQGWDSNQIVVFLEQLHVGPHVPASFAEAMDKAYGFGKATNGEILLPFYLVALEDKGSKYTNAAAAWVQTVGRMKYCRPVYRALYEVDKELARKTFLKSKSFYHPIAASMLEKDLGLLDGHRDDQRERGESALTSSAGGEADPNTSATGSSSLIGGTRTPCIVAVVGSTGTGKSQLAVDLAQAVRDGLIAANPSSLDKVREGEIISADSMQVYEGLDVITNKATKDEMGGIPHHLMDFLKPGEEYQVLDFVKDAKALIEEMHERSQPALPIIAGGTAYYTQHLLFPGRLIGSSSTTNEEVPVDNADSFGKQASLSAEDRRRLDSLLCSLTPVQRATWDELLSNPPPHLPDSMDRSLLWTTLEALDPDMAKRWHWKDGRKVARSLRVLGETGRRHSEWIAGQRRTEVAAARQQGAEEEQEHHMQSDFVRRARKIVFWVWCEPETLKKRLDDRVDKMVERGLLDEIVALRKIAAQAEARGEGMTDYTRGIYQAIGYKEFDAFLRLEASQRSPPTAEARTLLSNALTQMQTSTRQYAKKQTMWLRRQLIPTLLRDNETRRLKGDDKGLTRVYILDGTRRERWEEDVKKVAVELLRDFLDDKALPDAASLPSLSQPAREVISTLLADAQREVRSGADKIGETVKASTTTLDFALDDPISRNALQVCPECTKAAKPDEAASPSVSDDGGKGESEGAARKETAPEKPFLVRKDAWKAHLGSKKHRSSLKRLKRLEDKRRYFEAQAAKAEAAALVAAVAVKDDGEPSP